jgi:hypothetical protein
MSPTVEPSTELVGAGLAEPAAASDSARWLGSLEVDDDGGR